MALADHQHLLIQNSNVRILAPTPHPRKKILTQFQSVYQIPEYLRKSPPPLNKEEPCLATATWQGHILLQLIAVALQDSSFRQNNYDKALIFFAPSPSIIDGTD